MRSSMITATTPLPPTGRRGLPRLAPHRAAGWSFRYVFFSNGTPFDAPNRSETCPPS